MTSKKKIESNRKNSQRSTGPKDTTNTRMNAVKHGVGAGSRVIEKIDGEGAQEIYDEMMESIWEDLEPVGFMEEMMVREILNLLWKKRRLDSWQESLIEIQLDEVEDYWENPKQLKTHPYSVTKGIETPARLAALDVGKRLIEDGPNAMRSLTSGASIEQIPRIGVILPGFVESTYNLQPNRFVGGDQGAADSSSDGKLTAPQVRQLVESVCEHLEITEKQFRNDCATFIQDSLDSLAIETNRLGRSFDKEMVLAGTLDDANFNKMIKYDTKLGNDLSKLVKELKSRQELGLAKDRAG